MCLDKVMEIKLALAEKMIGGFKNGSIYAIATRPGVSKTRFCLNLLFYIAEKGGEVLFLTDSLNISE